MTDLGLLAWIREFAADSIGFDSKKLFEISCHPEKAGFSGSGFRILFARRGLFRVLVERCSMAMCHNEQSGFAEDWLHLGRAQASLTLHSVCTVFRDSNSVTNRSASRTQRARFYLHSAEVKPALAAKQQQYAPSFLLSAPCILLTLTHRLRFVSNPYFDTPSFAFFTSDSLAILL